MPSQKILEAKKKAVADMVSDYRSAQSFVFADARGLSVFQDTQMRAEFRKSNVNYKVIKNSKSALVFKELGIEGLDDIFKGPTAIAYSTEDLFAPAKVMKQFADKYEKLSLKGGVIEGKAASVAEVNTLASVPTKDVLCGQIAYGLLFPLTKLAMLLKAVAEKKEESGSVKADSSAKDAKPVEKAVETVEEKTEETVEAKTEEKPVEAKAKAKAEEVVQEASEPVAQTTEEAAE
jgi:large subunit ribosomal protein L10